MSHDSFLLQAPQYPCSVQKRFSRDHCCRVRLKHHENQRHGGKKTEINQARSKPDTVNRPVRTARIFVHHYNSTQYCNTETVLPMNIGLQTNIASQMWTSGGKGGRDPGGGESTENFTLVTVKPKALHLLACMIIYHRQDGQTCYNI